MLAEPALCVERTCTSQDTTTSHPRVYLKSLVFLILSTIIIADFFDGVDMWLEWIDRGSQGSFSLVGLLTSLAHLVTPSIVGLPLLQRLWTLRNLKNTLTATMFRNGLILLRIVSVGSRP